MTIVYDREVLHIDIVHRLVADGVYAKEELLSGRGANLAIVCSARSWQLCCCKEAICKVLYLILIAPLCLYLLGEVST